MVEVTATTTVAYIATVRLYLWETVVTQRGFSSVAVLCITYIWMPYSTAFIGFHLNNLCFLSL
jgi:hypothetical protein